MLDSLSIAGATLAALLQSCYTNGRPCVGLLFGHVTTAVSSQAQDTSDDVLVTQALRHITGSLTCIGTHTFYDNTGEVSEEQLAVLLSSSSSSSSGSSSCSSSSTKQQLLGWFSYRPTAPSIPSMLEAAVCQKLSAMLADSETLDTSAPKQQQQQRPLVFGLITSQAEHGGATVSMQHRFFAYHTDSSWQQGLEQQYRPSSTFASFGGGTGGTAVRGRAVQHPNLEPVELQVLNLGQPDMQRPGTAAAAAAGGGAAATAGSSFAAVGGVGSAAGGQYGGRQGIQQLAALAAAVEGLTAAGSANASAVGQQQLLTAAQQVDAAGGQLSVVQGLYSSLLEELQQAAAAVGGQQDRLVSLQETNQRLRGQVAGRSGLTSSSSGGGSGCAGEGLVHAHDLL